MCGCINIQEMIMADVTQTQPSTEQEEVMLSITPVAADKVREIMQQRELTGYALRVFVQGGGCSGMSYGMAFENNFYPQDNIVEVEGVRLVIDPMSLGYMQGAQIDFIDNLMGGGFTVHNPNAVSTCGCGHSFRTSDEDGSSGGGGGCNCH
jgi:iron-sulfur cluster assembly accessory protein